MYDFPGSEIHKQLSIPQLSDAYVPLYSTSLSKAELYNSIKYRAISTCMNLQIFSVLQQTFYKCWFCRGYTLLKKWGEQDFCLILLNFTEA